MIFNFSEGKGLRELSDCRKTVKSAADIYASTCESNVSMLALSMLSQNYPSNKSKKLNTKSSSIHQKMSWIAQKTQDTQR